MLETLKNAWKMADLRAKLLYTGMILLLFRIGAAIPVPFLKPDILKTYISGDNNWLGSAVAPSAIPPCLLWVSPPTSLLPS